jgi:large subunit ribosomal protein L23
VLFEVAREANKIEIAKAVSTTFGVTVTKVRTMVVRGKVKRVGRWVGKRPNWKKAVVTLAVGDKIEIVPGL